MDILYRKLIAAFTHDTGKVLDSLPNINEFGQYLANLSDQDLDLINFLDENGKLPL